MHWKRRREKNISDLICRSALLEEVKSLRVTVMGLRAGKGVLHEYAKQYRDTLVRIINEQPTTEAAQVERNKIIDEFALKAIERLEDMGCEAWKRDIRAIAEEMKGGAE